MGLAYVGIGSNLEEPRRQVEEAFAALARLPRTTLVRRSSLYRSAPVGYAGQPDFVNAVAELDTALSPEELLEALQAVEQAHGRRRSFANAPRTLDLDLLLFEGEERAGDKLTLPHPRMAERAFVLKPLVELAPQVRIPGIGPARERLEACAAQDVEKLA